MHAPDAEHAVPVAYNCAGNDAARAAPLRLPEEHWAVSRSGLTRDQSDCRGVGPLQAEHRDNMNANGVA